MKNYFNNLKNAMLVLSKDPRVIFLGQSVSCPGTGMFNTLKDINKNKLVELPVSEDFQMGVSNGLALNNMVPVSIFPRWNFLVLAFNQIVNHLDKMADLCSNKVKTKVIIRTAIGSERPLYPQIQHVGDFTDSLRGMCSNLEVIRLYNSNDILPSYKKALYRRDGVSTILVEYGDFYNEK